MEELQQIIVSVREVISMAWSYVSSGCTSMDDGFKNIAKQSTFADRSISTESDSTSSRHSLPEVAQLQGYSLEFLLHYQL